ncbi:Ser/Thr protein phosphatase 2A regulatory subunit B'' subunit alpha isoform 2 [Mucor ambiguus]|uniref:Ser/Thr protein phosphatase 2A regulatory subunit B'' subunit alpha isoform 2 n=1 Tax=Mucor ambiguus TaxID=91626 RepID=A0A0C9MNE2_9FUNG|nr:Ser/Thr protein phosphatase 2A regulatory subunit B'' subunit alpha isoform 2 [Mucor ambiguus]
MTIPLFYPQKACTTHQHDTQTLETIAAVKHIYDNRPYLTELQFIPVIKACGLPRYMNMAFFRKLEAIGNVDQLVSFAAFVEGYMQIQQHQLDDISLFFNILKKSNSACISPEDFLLVLEDVVLNHPGLKFLGDNPMFQERYIETVISRLYYDGKCASGRMSLSHFRRSNFTQMIQNLGPHVDLNNTRDCFSYKHFYVLYCKFWVLDQDHDLIISESDLANYNHGLFSDKLTRQIMQHGRIPAFGRENTLTKNSPARTLTYIDYIWFFMSETDKSTPVAIEYWQVTDSVVWKCMDDDGDGIITTFDLEEYWDEQEKRNDLIRPQIPGQFRLSDLKRNGIIAERFFDTFLNIEKFQIHDTYQGLIRANQQLESEKKRQYELEKQKLMELQHHFIMSQASHGSPDDPSLPPQSLEPEEPFSLGAWCDYAEQEYDILLLNEQCSNESIDSEWSFQQQQQHHHQQHNTAADGNLSSEEEDDDGDDEVDEDVESPNHSNCSSVTDESSSSSSSTPTTPVMQYKHDHKQPSLPQAQPSQQHQQQNWDLASY